MSNQFKTAEELMDYLKKQIVNYSNGEELDEFHENTASNNMVFSSNNLIDLSRILIERENNNILWNVSADRPIVSHRKFIGKFIVLGKKIVRKLLKWYVSETFELQKEFNGSVTRSINEISNTLQTMNSYITTIKSDINDNFITDLQQKVKVLMVDLDNLGVQLRDADIKFDSLNHLKLSVEETNNRLEEINNRLTEFNGDLINNTNFIRVIQEQESFNSQRLDQLNHHYNQLQEQIRTDNNFYNYRIRKLTKSLQSNLQGTSSLEASTHDFDLDIDSNYTGGDFDYLHFENKFRGSTEEIKNRQKVYLPYFNNSSQVLDIGCGRGEFVELLMENNIKVQGIDLNDDMVEYCQDRGLPVIKSDAIKYLASLENGQLGGIFLGQVIEHMPFDQIISLVDLAYSKLKPGSYLIMETPNPLSLAIFYRTFYVDPTHVKPVHPLTVQYIVEANRILQN
ncbi:methyltransferase domain-containing protein [Paenibacillus sp. P25]|nr:methyltransferase domain-containing protein [Paenibacillus sp. P25]